MGGSHLFHDSSLQESTHRVNIATAGARSRTYNDINRTSTGMLNYQNERRLLDEICIQAHVETEDHDGASSESAAEPRDDADYTSVKLSCIIKSREVAMTRLQRGHRGLHSIGDNIHLDTWDRILCEGVPVSLREIVSLATNHLRLQDNIHNRKKILLCSWSLGWHVTARDSSGVGTHYWGGGVTPKTTTSLQRGDWVEIEGPDVCRGLPTSRLARIICGVKISNVRRIFGPEISDVVWENESCKAQDYVVFLLVRYAMAHPDVGRARGPEHRPLCPGEFHDTHCLWTWYQRPANFRRGCWRPRPWERHKHMFGETEELQNLRKEQEARAWFDLIQTRNITCHTNVREDWDRPNSFLQSVMWC